MKLIDLSQPIEHAGPNCPAHPPISITRISDHSRTGWRMELLTVASHTGSHVDAPLHKIVGGAGIDDLSLDTFVGPAVMADFRGVEQDTAIDGAMLGARLADVPTDKIVLLATGWGERRAKTDEWLHHSPYLSPSGAQWLVDRGVRAVGIDHYSIGGSRDPDNIRTHEILLGGGKWIVEDLRFPSILFTLPQPFTFWSLPINLKAHSGAFCRPVVVTDQFHAYLSH